MRLAHSHSVHLLLIASLYAQPTPSPAPSLPAFDVASVRPSKPGIPQHTNVPLDTGNVYGAISPDDARTAAGFLIATPQPRKARRAAHQT